MAKSQYIPENLTEENKNQVLNSEIEEVVLPVSIYDLQVSSADGKKKNILEGQKGKVTLIFNVAAGCGNIPQHSVLEELNQKYKDNDDFEILAIVVDDFVCHGYPEFQDGIQAYIDRLNLDLTPGMVSKKYAADNFGSTYEFSELTNGRYDKHKYDSDYAPGAVKEQEQHELWNYLTGAYAADIREDGIPFHYEYVPWSNANIENPMGKGFKTYTPLRGNFEKFLIDRTGTKVKRFANGFLLGERDQFGVTFPWIAEKYTEDGRRDHNPVLDSTGDDKSEQGDKPWPNKHQRSGIDISLEAISRHIDSYLE
jgi:glutathione peroxidase-family protein